MAREERPQSQVDYERRKAAEDEARRRKAQAHKDAAEGKKSVTSGEPLTSEEYLQQQKKKIG